MAVGVGEGATGLFDAAVGREAPLLLRSVLADGLSLVRVVVEVDDGWAVEGRRVTVAEERSIRGVGGVFGLVSPFILSRKKRKGRKKRDDF